MFNMLDIQFKGGHSNICCSSHGHDSQLKFLTHNLSTWPFQCAKIDCLTLWPRQLLLHSDRWVYRLPPWLPGRKVPLYPLTLVSSSSWPLASFWLWPRLWLKAYGRDHPTILVVPTWFSTKPCDATTWASACDSHSAVLCSLWIASLLSGEVGVGYRTSW